MNSINMNSITNPTIFATLLTDGYKQTHAEQYPDGLEYVTSYFTPRKSRLNKHYDKMVFFGMQAFIRKWLIGYFNENFFNIPEHIVISEHKRVTDSMLGSNVISMDKIANLHRLGYLPIRIDSVYEGTLVPMNCPCIQITNTVSGFGWVVGFIESLLSAELWKSCMFATVGYQYRKIVDLFYEKTVSNTQQEYTVPNKDDGTTFTHTIQTSTPADKAASDFGFRGMSCLEEAMKASAGWLCSFSGSATIPVVPYLEAYYDMPNNRDFNWVANAVSVEHSVVCAQVAKYIRDSKDAYSEFGKKSLDEQRLLGEVDFVKTLLTNTYANVSFSYVADTYDYWRFIHDGIPMLVDAISKHNGKFLIRPDSGDIVDISIKTVECLYEMFKDYEGFTYVNDKGYKVINPKRLGVIYGDGVTCERALAIYDGLEKKGFAANNIVFGVGSFSFNATMDGSLDPNNIKPITRDTFSIAVKATHAVREDKSGTTHNYMLCKDPKTDIVNGEAQANKKSHCGLVYVASDRDNTNLRYTDHLENPESLSNLLHTFQGENTIHALHNVFYNGMDTFKVQAISNSLYDIRNRLYPKDETMNLESVNFKGHNYNKRYERSFV